MAKKYIFGIDPAIKGKDYTTKFVVLSPTQMKNKELVKQFKTSGIMVVENKKIKSPKQKK